MGAIHYEETANRITVSGCYSEAENRSSDVRNSERGSGRGSGSSSFCGTFQFISGGCFSGGKSSVLQSKSVASRVRESHGCVAQPSRIHRKEMGSGKPKGFETMKTLVTANQKGGVGKTATVVHLAFDFWEKKGLRVALIDLDTQANASYTLQEHDSGYKASQMFDLGPGGIRDCFSDMPDGPILYLIASDPLLANMETRSINEASKAFKENIAALSEYFDVVLIDTAPSLGVGMAAALYAADYVLSPIELEAYSIQGIKKMVTTIANIRKVNSKLHFLGMMPSKVDARNPRHKRHLNELEEAYPQLMIPGSIGLRSSIADALASCVPVWKIKKTAARKATKEVREVANFVFDKICAADSLAGSKRGLR